MMQFPTLQAIRIVLTAADYICFTYSTMWEWKHALLFVLYGNPALATRPRTVTTVAALAISFLPVVTRGFLKVENPPKRSTQI